MENEDIGIYNGRTASPVKGETDRSRFDFLGAILAILDRRRVCRKSWRDEENYVAMLLDKAMDSDILCIVKKDGPHAWIVAREDLEAGDWMVWRSGREKEQIREKGEESETVGGIDMGKEFGVVASEDGIHICVDAILTAREAYNLLEQIQDALFDWYKITGKKIDEGVPK